MSSPLLQASAKCKFCLFNLFFCYVTIIDKSWQNVCTQKHISLVSVWSAVSHIKTFYSGAHLCKVKRKLDKMRVCRVC